MSKKITCCGIKISLASGRNPVYCQYQGQLRPQHAYILFKPEEWSMLPDYNAEIGNAVSFSIWHGREFMIWVNPKSTCKCLNAMMREMAPIAEQIFNEYESMWNGNNFIGRYKNQKLVDILMNKLVLISEKYE